MSTEPTVADIYRARRLQPAQPSADPNEEMLAVYLYDFSPGSPEQTAIQATFSRVIG